MYERVITPRSCLWLVERSIGIADCFRSEAPSERKSISSESTFKVISSKDELLEKCKEIAENLAESVDSMGISGKCLTLKLKSFDFSIKQRSITLPR